MQITDVSINGSFLTLTVINHNLSVYEEAEESNEFVLVENLQTSDGGNLESINGMIFPIIQTNSVSGSDTNTIVIDVSGQGLPPLVGTYSGGGTLARVSNWNIRTKDYNPYRTIGKNVYIYQLEFMVDRTDPNPATGIGGQTMVDYYPSSSNQSTLYGAVPDVLFGSTPNVLETTPYPAIYYPLEQYQEQVWHTIGIQGDGTSMQFRIYMSDDQMINPDISLQDFQMHAFIINAKPISRIQ